MIITKLQNGNVNDLFFLSEYGINIFKVYQAT